MKFNNNRIVLDLNKCQWAKFHWVNQYGGICFTLINKPTNTVRGQEVSVHRPAMWHPDYPNESELERADRLNLLDIWTPVCTFQLAANHNVTYTGDKAKVMWKAWNEKIFNQKKGKK